MRAYVRACGRVGAFALFVVHARGVAVVLSLFQPRYRPCVLAAGLRAAYGADTGPHADARWQRVRAAVRPVIAACAWIGGRAHQSRGFHVVQRCEYAR